MKKKELLKKYNNYIKIFIEYNEAYYNKDKPTVSDQEYDELKKSIIDLEVKYSFLSSKKSPTNTVGLSLL